VRRSIPHISRYSHSDTSPWLIQGLRGSDGKRRRLFFPTKEAAETELARIKAEDNGALLLDASIRVMAREGTELLKPYGKSLRDAVEFYLAHLRSKPAAIVTVSALVTEFLAEQSRLGRSATHQNDQRQRYNRFLASFADREAQSIGPSEITAFLGSLALSPQSVNNFRACLSALFNFGAKRGYLERNPVAAIERIKRVDEPPEIFTPADLQRLLENAPTDLLPCLAIGAFAGLRTAEILRLEWSDIDLLLGHLNVRAKISKTAKRRLIVMAPALCEWLSLSPHSTGKLWPRSEREYHSVCQTARAAAGLAKWPNNGLRHSFASYHLAKHMDAPRLALDLGHTSTSMIFQHYRELVTPEAAETYWNIAPEARAATNIVPMVA